MGQPVIRNTPLSEMSEEDRKRAIAGVCMCLITCIPYLRRLAVMDRSELGQQNDPEWRRRPIPVRQVLPAGRKVPSGARFPVLVYGFPVSYEYGYIYAVRHNIAPHKTSEFHRGRAGVHEILKRLNKPVVLVDYTWTLDEKGRLPSNLIYLGSNENERQWKAAMNRERIEEIQRFLETKDEPQWLYRYGHSP